MRIGKWPLFCAAGICFTARAFLVDGLDGGLIMSGIVLICLGLVRHAEDLDDR